MGDGLRPKDMTQHFLGTGLSDGSRHGNQPALEARTCGGGKGAETFKHVWDHQQGRIGGDPFGGARDESRRSTLLEGLGHEIVPVAHILQRDEEVTGPERAGVDGNACRSPVRSACAPCRAHRFVAGPERAHAPSPSSAATATLACSMSSKGRVSEPMI